MEIFKKVLTIPDIERRLSFSGDCLQALPDFEGCHGIVLNVKDDDGKFWDFGCMIRSSSGFVPNLVVVSGWIKFVKTKHLHRGDVVVLYKEEDMISGIQYIIRTKKINRSNL